MLRSRQARAQPVLPAAADLSSSGITPNPGLRKGRVWSRAGKGKANQRSSQGLSGWKCPGIWALWEVLCPVFPGTVLSPLGAHL